MRDALFLNWVRRGKAMPDYAILQGDTVQFLPQFGMATLIGASPGVLSQATGLCRVNQRRVVVEGDEKAVVIPPCAYITPAHTIPGTGMIRIKQLLPNQLSQFSRSGGRKVVLKGGNFIAEFSPLVPAQIPPVPPFPPSIPDVVSMYPGTGFFVTTNVTTKFT